MLDPVFISYSRRDQVYVSRLVTSLRTAGMASWTSGPGRHCPAWRDAVFPKIGNCAVFVVVMTPWSQAAGGVAEEISYARSLQKSVIPVAVDGCDFAGGSTLPVAHAKSYALPGEHFIQRVQAAVAANFN